MSDTAEALDPFQVAVTRAKMDEVSGRAAAGPFRDPGEFTNTEATRIIGRFLIVTGRKLGLPENRVSPDLGGYIRDIVMAAQGGKLGASDYRCLHLIWSTLSQPSRQPDDEPAAEAGNPA